ncbi:MAG: archease [Deltaproteobacteria bacterium]|nr:archease [Deltaproteobacteria bacterium]
MATKPPDYALLDHTADLGIIVHGEDLKNLYETAAKALMHLMIRGKSQAKPTDIKITVSGQDLPDLLVRWLGEILYFFEGEDLVVTCIHIDFLSLTRLDATLKTVPFNPTVHRIQNEIKAVTYHQVQVMEKGSVWEAQVIFDT